MINNAIAPSTEIDRRSFSFDLISSGAIDQMLIYKSATAEQPGDFAGGLIQVITKQPTNEEFVQVGMSVGYRPNATGQTTVSTLGSSTAAKAVAFGECLTPEFRTYSAQVVSNPKALTAALVKRGYRITTGGTDNHLMLVDLRQRSDKLTGAEGSKWLETAGIICNMNGIPNDPRPPRVTSGIRLGTPALTTRGMKEPQMELVADFFDRTMAAGLAGPDELAKVCKEVRGEIEALCTKFSMPH